MTFHKRNSPPSAKNTIDKEWAHFLHVKEKECKRSRSKALEAMVLLEQRKGATIVNENDENSPKSKSMINVGCQYTDDGKLLFNHKETIKVQRLRDLKNKRIQAHLKTQDSNTLSAFVNERFPFVLKSELAWSRKNLDQRNSSSK